MNDTERLDFLERYLMSICELTTPDMAGWRFVGQIRNPAKERGEAGPGMIRIRGTSIRDAIDRAANP